ncbi:hypothetical protein J6590_081776 [Homalodisca vitripennis]|nr:hypothetical protein J6590_081776 [Homalodisca vitripennis]
MLSPPHIQTKRSFIQRNECGGGKEYCESLSTKDKCYQPLDKITLFHFVIRSNTFS